ncbi:MAG: SpoIIE family protein phosphatase, partial [Lentisphaerota bacterium]
MTRIKNILFRKSLITKVILSYIVCLVATVSIIVIYNYHSIREYTAKDLHEKAHAQVQMLIIQCEKLLDRTEQITYDLSNMLSTFHLKMTNNDINESLMENLIWNPNIKSITIAYQKDKGRKSGFESVNISLDPNIPVQNMTYLKFPEDCSFANMTYGDFCEEDWYIDSQKEGNLNGKWFGRYANKGILTYTYPLYYYEGKKETIEGIIKVDLKLDWLFELIKKVKIYEKGYCSFLSKHGDFLARNGKIINIFEYAKEANDPSLIEAAKKIMVKNPTIERYYNPRLDERVMIFSYPYRSWWFGIIVPEEEFFEEMLTRIMRLLAVGLVCLLIPIPLIIYLTFRQTRFLSNLTRAADQIGSGNFDAELPPVTTSDEVGVLNGAFIKMKENIKAYIENVRLMTEARQQIEDELRIAKSIQKSIIPRNFPDIKEIEFSAFIQPAKSVGGDFYDFFFIDETHFCFMIGDVSGKSISGAMFMALSRTMIRSKLISGLGLCEALDSVNKSINEENDSAMFLTLFAGILDIRTGALETCNAGHCPPALSKNSYPFEFLDTDSP